MPTLDDQEIGRPPCCPSEPTASEPAAGKPVASDTAAASAASLAVDAASDQAPPDTGFSLNTAPRTQRPLRHWQWAMLGSVSLHAAVIGTAALGTMSVTQWQTSVQQGDAAQRLLVMRTGNPAPPTPPISPIAFEEAKPPDRAEAARSLSQLTEHRRLPDPSPAPQIELVTATPPTRSEALAATDLPAVRDLAVPRPQRRPTLEPPPATVPPAPLPAVALPSQVGAKTDALPQKLPENPPPVYPDQARRLGQQGRVVLVANLDETGTVVELAVETSSGFHLLDQAALEAVWRWRFQPALASNRPRAAELRIPVRFSIRSDASPDS